MTQGTLHDCAGLPQSQDADFVFTDEECGYGIGSNQDLSIAAGILEAPAEENASILPLAMVERMAIKEALAYCRGNIPRAALLLEVSPSTIYRKINNWE